MKPAPKKQPSKEMERLEKAAMKMLIPFRNDLGLGPTPGDVAAAMVKLALRERAKGRREERKRVVKLVSAYALPPDHKAYAPNWTKMEFAFALTEKIREDILHPTKRGKTR